MSKVIKSAKANTTSESWQLGIQTVKSTILENNFNETDNEHVQTENERIIAEKREELLKIERREKDLQNKLLELEQLIIAKEERLHHLEQELNTQSLQIKQQAHQEGFENGFKEGSSKAELEHEQILKNARKVLQTIEIEKINKIEAVDEIIIDLSVQIARKIIGDTLDGNKDAWLSLLKNAITEIKEKGEIKLFVHPNQFDLTNGIREEFELKTQMSIFVYPDGNLEEYQCLIETKNGSIDASLDTQLEVLREKLTEVVKGEID